MYNSFFFLHGQKSNDHSRPPGSQSGVQKRVCLYEWNCRWMPHCWYRQSNIAVVQHLSPTLTQATWSSAETDYSSTMPVCRDCCHHSRVPVVMAVWPGCIYSPCVLPSWLFSLFNKNWHVRGLQQPYLTDWSNNGIITEIFKRKHLNLH